MSVYNQWNNNNQKKLISSRFGNFIGEVEESEDDSQHGVDAGAYEYDDYPEEEEPEATGQELMEIDGPCFSEQDIEYWGELTFCRWGSI